MLKPGAATVATAGEAATWSARAAEMPATAGMAATASPERTVVLVAGAEPAELVEQAAQ